MADHVLSVRSLAPLPPALGDLLRERGTAGIWEVSMREWKAYFPSADAALLGAVRACCPEAEAAWSDEESVDWAARYQATLKPFAVGRRFAVLPSPDIENPWPSRLSLRLVQGTAFGTGEHYTTASCLRALESISPLPDGVLDVGCGSGILAAAACGLGASRVLGCDTDPEACRVARETGRVNGAAFDVVEGSASDVPGAWNLVLANILGETLVEIFPHLSLRTASGGLLVGSGIRLGIGPEVLKAARGQAFELLESRTDGLWRTFLWRRE